MEYASPMPLQLSVVVPFHDESPSLAELYAELSAVLASFPFPSELIFVDDASDDDGAVVVAGLAGSDPRVRLLWITPRSGQSTALEAGFRAARGEWIATLDADLQNDPADLPRLVAAMGAADCVCGVRVERRDRLSLRVASRLANGIRRRVLGDGIEDIGCSLRIMRREHARRIKLFRGAHRFLPVLLALEGARVVERPVRHRPRRHGRSRYGIWMRLRVVWADLLGVAWLARRVARYEVKELSRRV